jgi:hypothetical protein
MRWLRFALLSTAVLCTSTAMVPRSDDDGHERETGRDPGDSLLARFRAMSGEEYLVFASLRAGAARDRSEKREVCLRVRSAREAEGLPARDVSDCGTPPAGHFVRMAFAGNCDGNRDLVILGLALSDVRVIVLTLPNGEELPVETFALPDDFGVDARAFAAATADLTFPVSAVVHDAQGHERGSTALGAVPDPCAGHVITVVGAYGEMMPRR